MGFKDAEWAYNLDGLPMMQKVVLAAICMRADDKSHTTYVGQQTIAAMISSSSDSVRRALRDLEISGVIQRARRHGRGGFRTSDLITINRAYQAESLEGTEPSGPTTYKADRCDLTGSQPEPTRQSAGAKEITQIDHSEDHPVIPEPDRFSEFYAIWPRKVNKPAAEKAWARAVIKEDAAVIIASAAAYRDNPARPQKQYIPYPATWLNADGWNDELPEAASSQTRPTPTDRAVSALTSMLGTPQALTDSHSQTSNIIRLPRQEIS